MRLLIAFCTLLIIFGIYLLGLMFTIKQIYMLFSIIITALSFITISCIMANKIEEQKFKEDV